MSGRATFSVLETVSVCTPLGIRFWDPVTDEQIRDALRVTAWPADAPGRAVTAYRSRSDIYVLQGLPGLRDLEYPSDLDEPTSSPPPQRPFVIQVEDDQRRYLPAARAVDLPLPYRGVYPRRSTLYSPSTDAPPGFLLLSTVARQRPSWMAGIYGELFDQVNGRPATHAMIQVSVGGEDGYGLSDGEGRFAVWLPYPGIAQDITGSPPPALGLGSLFGQSWPLELRVLYDPDHQVALSRTELPDYLSLLTQPLADLWLESPELGASPGLAEVWSGALDYGRELSVTTLGAQRLLIEPR
jgi:hypothetical protein